MRISLTMACSCSLSSLIYLLLVIAPSWNFGVAHAASRCPGENKKNKELLCEVKSENKEIKELLLEVKSDLGKLLAICKPADKGM